MIIPSASNIFDFDWYGRSATLSGGETSYCSFVVKDDVAKRLVGSNPLDDVVRLSWFLTRFQTAISKNRGIVYINEKSDESYTDGHSIMVSSLPNWDNPEGTSYWRLDTYIGLALHEASHVRYSNFRSLTEFPLTQTEKWLSNVIEDEAIENSLRNKFSGAGKFFDNVKSTCLGIDEFDVNSSDNKLQEILNILFAVIRIPNYIGTVLSDKQKKDYGKLFFEIYNIMNLNGCLIKPANEKLVCNTEKNIKASKEICELIKTECGCSDDDMDKQQKQKSSAHDGSDSDQKQDKENNESGNSTENNKPSDGELKETLKELENEFEDAVYSMLADEGNLDEELSAVNEGIKVLCESNNWKNAGKSATSDMAKFKRYEQLVYPYISKMVNALTIKNNKLNYNIKRYSMTGSLDGSLVASAFTGNKFTNKRIEQKKEKSTKKLAVVLIADMSGSMECGGAGDRAGALVTLFSEAVMKLPGCELYVYTHNDSLYEICDHSSFNKNKYNIGSISAGRAAGPQSETMAYKTAVESVRKRTDLPICMINFTDSDYCSGVENIINTVNEIKQQFDCQTTLISVNEKKRSEVNNLIYGENNYINMHSMRPNEMVEMIKKATKIISRMYK